MDRRYSNSFSDFNCRNFINFCHAFCKKALAFTLAETLIVMGIIGVVAALTLPNLNSSTGDKEKVARVKKIYQNLNDAFGRATAVYGPYNTWFINDTTLEQKNKRFGERMTEFMKVSKSCGVNSGGCSANNYKYLYGENAPALNDRNMYTFILADGMNVGINRPSIYVDIDGANKGPNTFGKDVFAFYVVKSELGPYCYDADDEEFFASFEESNIIAGLCASDWILRNENMDYLKCPLTLSWTNTTCK